MLEQLHRALEEFVIGFRPVRPDPDARLRAAAEHFARRTFSRRDYLALHRGISQATASRDLRQGVERGALRIRGDKATARYNLVSRRR
jgi:Fic family protein